VNVPSASRWPRDETVNDLLKYRSGASSEWLDAEIARLGETPSSKLQASNTHQTPARLEAIWCLMLGTSLELGGWCLQLSLPA
jgi:hypothetical protein